METAHVSTVIADQPPLDIAEVLDADLDINANQSQVETQPKTNPTVVIEAGLDDNVEQFPLKETTPPKNCSNLSSKSLLISPR